MWVNFYRAVVWLLTLVYKVVWCRVTVLGRENIPRDGRGYILCANHLSNVDPILLAVSDHRQIIHFMGKEELFRFPFLRAIFRRLGGFPVRRGQGDTGAIKHAIELIQGGGVLGIFPEGTRSKDGQPLRPKSGIALIAGETGADLLPCGIWYERGGPRFRGRVVLRYGRLITHEELAYAGRSAGELKRISRLVMDEIVALTGPEMEGER